MRKNKIELIPCPVRFTKSMLKNDKIGFYTAFGARVQQLTKLLIMLRSGELKQLIEGELQILLNEYPAMKAVTDAAILVSTSEKGILTE